MESSTRLEQAGVDLTARAIQRSRHPQPRRPHLLTSRDLRLLAFLHDFGCATTTQLAVLFWGKVGYAAQRRLKLLHDAGLVMRVRPRALAGGSHDWIYLLARDGWSALVGAQLTADAFDYRSPEINSLAYLEHDLQVVSLIATIARHAVGAERALLDAAPFKVLGPRAGRIDAHGRRSVEQAIEPVEVRLETAVPGMLEPDATLVGATPDGRSAAVLIEYDRTRRAAKQRARLRRYDHFLTIGWRHSRYQMLDLEPILLLVCDDDRRVPTFAATADQELQAHVLVKDDSVASGHRARELTAITSRPRLLRADWLMLQPPPLPPNSRAGRAAARTLSLDIVRLLSGTKQRELV